MNVFTKIKNAWSILRQSKDQSSTIDNYVWNRPLLVNSIANPVTPLLTRNNIRTIVGSVYNHIAVDCSQMDIKHVRVDEDDKYKETIQDSLHQVLTRSANKDQTGRELIKDIVISLLDEGVVAVVPFETEGDPNKTESYDILKARTARILQWSPDEILVKIYNEDTGVYEEMWVSKKFCAIIENPFYLIMNEPNSVAQRLKIVLNQLDRTNDRNSSGKLDLIIEFPFPMLSTNRKDIASERKKEIEDQLRNSQLGIAYINSTEKVIQLNRPVENNLWEQAKELTTELFNLLGFSESILNGTANEEILLNYYNRTIEPILTAISEEMERKWLTKTAISQGQAIRYFRNPFKLVPVNNLAKIADTFTRNEIMSSNEFRAILCLKPSDDPKADQLINSNINHPGESKTNTNEKNEEIQNETKKEE